LMQVLGPSKTKYLKN